MSNCKFCNVNYSIFYNTILEETKHFFIIPSVGSLVDGYVLIVSKTHFLNMLDFNNDIKKEYLFLIDKYRMIFKNIYGRYPIIFEHGTGNKCIHSASSIVHAHTHIVNHCYCNEKHILKDNNFVEFDITNYCVNNRSYIMYISNDNKRYISTSFFPKNQLMRYYIAKDLNILNKYDWKNFLFSKNIISTINKIKTIDK